MFKVNKKYMTKQSYLLAQSKNGTEKPLKLLPGLTFLVKKITLEDPTLSHYGDSPDGFFDVELECNGFIYELNLCVSEMQDYFNLQKPNYQIIWNKTTT